MPWLMIAKYWKPLGVVCVAVVIFACGYIEGSGRIQAKWEAEKHAQEIAALETTNHQAQATVGLFTGYVDRVQVVQGKTRTIIKEVPVYVPAQADADCVINNGFVWLHDSAAANTIPIAAGAADAAPSGVALSTLAGTVAENYGACHENAEQLRSLQRWITAMAETSGGEK